MLDAMRSLCISYFCMEIPIESTAFQIAYVIMSGIVDELLLNTLIKF